MTIFLKFPLGLKRFFGEIIVNEALLLPYKEGSESSRIVVTAKDHSNVACY